MNGVARKILLSSFLLLAAANAFGQFRAVGGGLAFSTGTEVLGIGYAMAGGGVVLRGVAHCDGSAEQCALAQASIGATGNGDATLHLGSPGCMAQVRSTSWVFRDAALLVSSETADIYRNVNLLGTPTDTERETNPDMSKYFFVEVSDALRGRKAGELLIAIDVMLTDPVFYAHFDLNRASDPIGHADASYDVPTAAVLQLISGLRSIPDADFSNWTWNDEHANYSYRLDCAAGTLKIGGTPSYTFLRDDGSLDHASTSFFLKNYKLILDLNRPVYNYAIQFARIAALFRSLRDSNPPLWDAVLRDAHFLPASHGTTPRVIVKEE